MTDIAESDDAVIEEDGAAPKKSRRLLFIIIAAVVALALAGGVSAFLFLGGPSEVEEAAPVVAKETYFYELPEMTVNLNTAPGEGEEFLKLSVALELPDQEMVQLIAPRMPRVLDAFQVYLRELRRSDLEGSAGIFRLKEELRRRVNLAIYPAQVDSILFKEILVQ